MGFSQKAIAFALFVGVFSSANGNTSYICENWPMFDNLTANLEEIVCPDLGLTGSIPDFFTNFTTLRRIDLSNNELTGTLPSMNMFSQLTSLNLEDNHFSGPLPGDLPMSLSAVALSKNSFSGPIPSTVGDLIFLEELYLSENQLTGSIPASLGNLTNLLYLDLGDNMLTGSLPAALAMNNLLTLSIANNKLEGCAPIVFEDLCDSFGDFNGTNTGMNATSCSFQGQACGENELFPSCSSNTTCTGSPTVAPTAYSGGPTASPTTGEPTTDSPTVFVDLNGAAGFGVAPFTVVFIVLLNVLF